MPHPSGEAGLGGNCCLICTASELWAEMHMHVIQTVERKVLQEEVSELKDQSYREQPSMLAKELPPKRTKDCA